MSAAIWTLWRHREAYLEWNTVPFSKYPSWCTSSMSPYLDLRWQRKGLCMTSTFTSASGSFPPLAACSSSSSREEQNQLSTVSSMLHPHRAQETAQNWRVGPNVGGAAAAPSTWHFHHACCCRKSPSDWLRLCLSPAHWLCLCQHQLLRTVKLCRPDLY